MKRCLCRTQKEHNKSKHVTHLWVASTSLECRIQKEHNRVDKGFLEGDNLVIMSLKIKFVFKEDADLDGNVNVSRHVGQVNSVFCDDLSNKMSRQSSQNV